MSSHNHHSFFLHTAQNCFFNSTWYINQLVLSNSIFYEPELLLSSLREVYCGNNHVTFWTESKAVIYFSILMFVDSLVPIYGFPIYQRWERDPNVAHYFIKVASKGMWCQKGFKLSWMQMLTAASTQPLYLSLFRSSNLLASIEVVGWPRFLKTCQLRGLSSGKVWVGYLFPRAFYPFFTQQSYNYLY